VDFSEEAIFINTLAADIEVIRSVLAAMLVGPAKARAQAYSDMKAGVLEGVAQLGLDAPRTQDNERVRQLTLQRAEAFFADVETLAGILQTKQVSSSVN
jgi:hypothetical protein